MVPEFCAKTQENKTAAKKSLCIISSFANGTATEAEYLLRWARIIAPRKSGAGNWRTYAQAGGARPSVLAVSGER
jgi:hypothetical protein